MVLLDSGMVAVDPQCCCPSCTDCSDDFLFSPFSDGMGNCFTTQECDGSLSGPVLCTSRWLNLVQHCVGDPPTCTELCNVTIVDPVTCDLTNTCDCCDCCAACENGTVNSVADEAILCLHACCVDGVCSLQTFPECNALGGIFLIGVSSCDPNPC